jgi:exodeoxyribonuclease VIII
MKVAADPLSPGEPGIREGVPLSDYLAMPGIDKTRLWSIVTRTPRAFKWELDHPEEIDGKALALGRAAHTAILEPEQFRKRYWLEPAVPEGKTRACKDYKDARALLESLGSILTADDWASCLGMRDAWQSHPTLRLLTDPKPELSLFWMHPATGLYLKGRVDILYLDGGILVDLKTTRCGSKHVFGRDAYKYGYHIQLAMYMDGLTANGVTDLGTPKLVAVEKTPPHDIYIYDLEPEVLALGRRDYERALAVVRKCLDANEWPGPDPAPRPLQLPPYAGSWEPDYAEPGAAEADEGEGNELGIV